MPTTADDRIPTAARREVDVLVVGGGINGAGIARDLAGRGARVLLCEKDDLAAHTSSASTKLIHGGLRYLEYYEFALVKKALAEREVLLKGAPHIMSPLRFVMPHDPSMRPVWMIRIGLFLYDHLARREVLPGSRVVDLHAHAAGGPLKPEFTKGFVYSDGWVDDARLVTLCAVDAAEHGATVLTRTACVDAVRGPDHWQVRLESARGGTLQVAARSLVNATGPWAAEFLMAHAHAADRVHLRLVKGSHIVVPRIFEHDHAYIFQNADGRIIFAIPYEGAFTLIGTTDVEHHGAIGDAHADAGEIEYLCIQASRYFARVITPAQVVWTYSGVRPLLDDESGNPAAVTRDYRLELDRDGGAPLLSVWGGKLTTFRKLAEETAELLAPALPGVELRGPWTASAPLPGGDLGRFLGDDAPPPAAVAAIFARFVDALRERHPQIESALVHRLARCYGTRAVALLARGLGTEIAPGVFAGELAHLRVHEWARTGDDVLWRRTKLGLHLDAAGRAAVDAWMAVQGEDERAFDAEDVRLG
ncbi:MAG TPA: glycerol-3-phosphate dehydrogenase [Caldimonas sp.]|jgi:glycerol-3-phosphate dehydrogenase|nr:glycerol-3-phosphate dehydrogenase [Caldimonas sp.]HEX4233070.1 glycerol-3-phosphate dehydrogenase [Caldimonas sp.]